MKVNLIKGQGYFVPHDQETQDWFKGLPALEIVRGSLTPTTPEQKASVEQNNLLHKVFELIADNSDDKTLDNQDKVKFACKVGIDFRYYDRVAVTPGGKVVAEYRSFAFDKLKGQERIEVIEKAFLWCADISGLSVQELVEEAKSRMRTYRR